VSEWVSDPNWVKYKGSDIIEEGKLRGICIGEILCWKRRGKRIYNGELVDDKEGESAEEEKTIEWCFCGKFKRD